MCVCVRVYNEMSREKEVARYLADGPPYLGESSFADKAKVKSYGARWNAQARKWEARSVDDFLSLLRCGLWVPTGFDRSAVALFVQSCADSLETPTGPTVAKKGGAAHAADTWRFDRRAAARYDPEKDTETTPRGKVYAYVARCDACKLLLDSRLQFGLECDCAMACAWTACHACFFPTRPGAACRNCYRSDPRR